MRMLALIAAAAAAGVAAADDKGTAVELAGMKSAAPATWKEKALPPGSMRLTQFTVPKAAGDKEDAEVAVFFFRGGGSGSVEQNLQRQTAKFEPAAGKGKVEETVDKGFKVGPLSATYQDVKGTFLSKFPPFAPDAKVTRKPDYRELYVIFETKDGQYYVWLLGPATTVEQNKKGFDEWLKNFK